MASRVRGSSWAETPKPELRDTTMKTFFQTFPESVYGKRKVTDFEVKWEFRPQGFDHSIEAEFLFRALDTPDDVANLLGLEVTGIYFNEIREIDYSVLTAAIMRAGRYPSAEMGGCKWKGVFGDTNTWHDQHPLHALMVDERTRDKTTVLFRQPSGLAANAENLENLNQTRESMEWPFDDPRRRELGRTYYTRHKFSPEDARVYVEAEWGHTRAGKPIYTEYRDQLHCKAFELDAHLSLRIGYDWGRTPAAVIAQLNPWGAWRIRWELCTEDMGLVAFAQTLSRFIADKAPGYHVDVGTGDPSGMAKDSRDHTAFDI